MDNVSRWVEVMASPLKLLPFIISKQVGKFELSNRKIKRIWRRLLVCLGNIIHLNWMMQFGTYKVPIIMSTYRLVFGKTCALPVELKHKAYWHIRLQNILTLKTASCR